ncbi:hypothetical protein PR048_027333 [Dryococelus australis]|uniref:Uncharacterized protein n=1 Tax=Dryococelus australis TaxID=614101 RepID=A0ABQ9GF52_9NEOP|nr:hypothetical protein PR048_027333 [Dryococelus australis]
MRLIEVNMERHRNEGAEETGDPRENPPTNGIVRHDSHLRKSGDPGGIEPAPFIKPCSRNDPNLDECTLKNGIAAIPSIIVGDRKYKIPKFNPLEITEIRIEDGNNGQVPTGLDVVLKDLKVYGLDHLQLKKVQ